MSTLSQSLYQFGNLKKQCVRDAHVNNISNVYPMDINYGGIYTPNVIFFRNNIDKYYTYRVYIIKPNDTLKINDFNKKNEDRFIFTILFLEYKIFIANGINIKTF